MQLLTQQKTDHSSMFKLEKKNGKAILTAHGYVGGYYLESRNISAALEEVKAGKFNELDFHIHSYGGSVFDGNLIYNFLAAYEGTLTIYIDGIAASMASVIMLAADKIYIAENGFIMIHKPSGTTSGTDEDHESAAKLLRAMGKNFVNKLIERTGKTVEEVAKWVSKTNNWFDAEEAVKLGLATATFRAKPLAKTVNKEELNQMGARAAYEMYAVTPPTPKEMKKEELIANFGLEGVTAENTDAEVMAALKTKMNASTVTEEASAAAQKQAIEAIVDTAIDSGKIDKSKRDAYVSRGEILGAGELRELLADMKPYKPIAGQLEKPKGGTGDPRANWTWEDYQAKAPRALEALQRDEPAAFAKIYKDEFGVEPEV